MSKLTDIKYRIAQMDGGAFQNLCDAYLFCCGYKGEPSSLGMRTGTDKTAKGNPDTHFRAEDGKYILAMYTTQERNFVKKAMDDLKKCFDPDKTGLQPEDIAEIVYCHTYGRISPGDSQKLHAFCEARNVPLKLVGTDELGNELFLKYPFLAKDLLGVSVDTGQISSMPEFIQKHDSVKMSAPLDTEFLFREEELRNAKEKLERSNVLVLSGPAGVGKTRLVLQLCEEVAVERNYDILCVKSNGLELYEDLVAFIEPDRNYLIFVDDANELTGLHFVLDFLHRGGVGKRSVSKIVMTVRDYTRTQVVKQILEVEKPEILKVGPLSEDAIRKLLEKVYGIKNHTYLDHIAAIAGGNARLAMLAGKVAIEKGCLSSICDVTELYAHYYEPQIKVIAGSETGVASAALMAFFQTLRLDNLQTMQPVFDALNLTESWFISDLRQFHAMELVDLSHDKAAKISDQSFSNYLIKYAFVDERIIPLSRMIRECFFINREKTIDACNILLRVFSDDAVQDYVEKEIGVVWDSMKQDAENFFPFFRAAYIVRPTESLVLLSEKIALEPPRAFDVRSTAFQKTNNTVSLDDDIIDILCGFKRRMEFPTAVDLLLEYYRKRPDLFEQVYSAFAAELGMDREARRYDYFTQKTVVEKLCEAVESEPTNNLLILFVRVTEQYLKFDFSKMEGRRKNYIYYTISLRADEAVLNYRRILLEELLKVYESEKCCGEIERLLMGYCEKTNEQVDYALVRHDMEYILSFFERLSPESLAHCVIAGHIKEVSENAQYDLGRALEPFLMSRKYEIYRMLSDDLAERNRMEYEEYEAWHKERIKEWRKRCDRAEFQYVFRVCGECLETVDQSGWLLTLGVKYVVETPDENEEQYVEMIEEYIKADMPYDARVDVILCNLFRIMPADEVKELIQSHDFCRKISGVKQVSTAWADDLLRYLDNVPSSMPCSPYRPLNKLEKYMRADRDVILKASRIVASHYQESPYVFYLYFGPFIDSDVKKADETIAIYESDFPLLEEIYLKCVAYSASGDYGGTLLAKMILNDPDFLYRYLDKRPDKMLPLFGTRDAWMNRLDFIWIGEAFASYMDRISEYLFEKAKGNSQRYGSLIGQLLRYREEETVIAEKQERWIQNTIEKYCFDSQRMHGLFYAVSEQNIIRRKKTLEILLEWNDDYEFFEKLPLEASGWSVCGSLIPYMQERIDDLISLLPVFSGAKYLKHKQRVERAIDVWKNLIKNEEDREILEAMG